MRSGAGSVAYCLVMRAFRAVVILGVSALSALTCALPSSAIERSTGRISDSPYGIAPALKRIAGARCAIGTQSANPLTVPVGIVHSAGINAVLVGICVNGLGPFPFVVDTGAAVTVFSETLATRLKLARTGASEEIGAIDCNVTARQVGIRNWTIGGRLLAPQNALSLEFPRAPLVTSIDGLIGSDLLSRFGAIRIDYQTQELTLMSSEAPAPRAAVSLPKSTKVKTPASLLAGTNPNAIGLTVLETPQITSISTTVDFGRVAFNFIVDTGASISLVSSTDGPRLKAVSDRFSLSSAGCLVEGTEVASAKWSVGPVGLPQQHLGVVRLPSVLDSGVIGSDVFFEAHVVVIDYRNARMFLGSGVG
jgi:predicted aspartyl protease